MSAISRSLCAAIVDHESAAADLAPDEVAFLQEVERSANRGARDAEAARDLALGRQPVTVAVNAIGDGAPKLAAIPAEPRLGAGGSAKLAVLASLVAQAARCANSRPHSVLRKKSD